MQDVTGKVAFITGGASGMGLAMARSFANAGMKVVIADIEEAALAAARREFEASNVEFLTLKVDVTDRESMAEAADAAEERFGKVHVVCNNAGVAVGGTVDENTWEDWDWVTGVNIDGVVNGIQIFVERMKRHGEGGHFVNTASMAGHIPVPGLGIYAMTKYAVVGISETMRVDLAPLDIGVSVLCPGVVNTNIFNSERNRPESLPGDSKIGLVGRDLPENATDAQREERMRLIREGALDPAIVGDMVLHAIRENEFYIFTHPELKAMSDARFEDMASAYERWGSWREERGVKPTPRPTQG
ncbi:MAG: SDR family NAD(P)-dependent oxidoreductase [Gammaproteobacteria bacterium]|nr:SDR family NAD(P)-dependent oxidoreductase [Gammaproteobacteria bacterium]